MSNMDSYAVVCTDWDADRPDEDVYWLATRQLFATREEAERYAATVAESRKPLVVAGRWHQLRAPVEP